MYKITVSSYFLYVLLRQRTTVCAFCFIYSKIGLLCDSGRLDFHAKFKKYNTDLWYKKPSLKTPFKFLCEWEGINIINTFNFLKLIYLVKKCDSLVNKILLNHISATFILKPLVYRLKIRKTFSQVIITNKTAHSLHLPVLYYVRKKSEVSHV